MYLRGEGVKRDYQEAFMRFEELAESNSEAKYYLGLMYENGYGIKQDYQKAAELLGESARAVMDYLMMGDDC